MGAGPLILSWINEICSADTEKRALLVAMANDLAYVVQAVVSTYRIALRYTKADRLAGTQLCLENNRISCRSEGIYLGCGTTGSAK